MLKAMKKFLSIMAILAVAGCATLPAGPSVRVLPAPGKTFEQFQIDDSLCRQWADQRIGITAQETYDRNTAAGAVAGTIIGGGIGAAIGEASGHAGPGAVIGAGTGLLYGMSTGAYSGEYYGSQAQRRYDNAYVQCMYAKGNQIPGVVVHRVRKTLRPPPPRISYPVPPDYVEQN